MQNQSLNMKKFLRTCLSVYKEFYQQQQQIRHYQHQIYVLSTSVKATCVNKERMSVPSPVPVRIYSKFIAATESPNLGSIPLCEERAQDLISNLKDSERAAIKTALAKYEAMKLKEGFEGKLFEFKLFVFLFFTSTVLYGFQIYNNIVSFSTLNIIFI